MYIDFYSIHQNICIFLLAGDVFVSGFRICVPTASIERFSLQIRHASVLLPRLIHIQGTKADQVAKTSIDQFISCFLLYLI